MLFGISVLDIVNWKTLVGLVGLFAIATAFCLVVMKTSYLSVAKPMVTKFIDWVRDFFDSPKTIVLFVLFILAVCTTGAGAVYSAHKNKLLTKSRKVVDQAVKNFDTMYAKTKTLVAHLEERNKELQALKEKYGMAKAVEKKKQDDIVKNLKADLKKVDNLCAKKLRDEFKKLGY